MAPGRGGNTKEKTRQGLAWTSLVFAAVAGSATSTTFVGDIIKSVVGFIPGVPAIVCLVLLGIAAWDIFKDGEPNQHALYVGYALPSVALAANGKLADYVTQGANLLDDWASSRAGEWLGLTAPWLVMIGCALTAQIMARRVLSGR